MAARTWTTNAKADRSTTTVLARGPKRGIILRSPENLDGRWAANVKHVFAGDTIDLYNVQPGDNHPLGRFRVVAPDQHPNPHLFGEGVEETALWTVVDEDTVQLLRTIPGYNTDGRGKVYVAWPVVLLSDAPPFDRKLFPGQGTLVRVGGN
jgi:hypothetical protein